MATDVGSYGKHAVGYKTNLFEGELEWGQWLHLIFRDPVRSDESNVRRMSVRLQQKDVETSLLPLSQGISLVCAAQRVDLLDD